MNILFVCTGNTCRSCMAEAIANSLKDNELVDVEFSSAGIYAVKGQSASQNATAVMKEMGIDISLHIASPVTEEILMESDLVLTLAQSHKKTIKAHYNINGLEEKLFTVSEYVGVDGSIEDPFGGDIAVYRECSKEIRDIIVMLIKKIKESKGNK